ncbi:thiamine phosphate synthase [Novosphingobium cyanobacteriorum]|uniref:Thiamine phosphate synthase n=1 Tax=Novosphingobium cyanobacteriorum TaxID=3024215 RepID=A0ABT6CHV5_9SPHN|nr:thiamine phosphate synthase [Novosphingobium cyanobacteriorum]MDF8333509.1 thiamine phosphate synthase [Novosphingobium cyanobacteriorum]
MAKRYPVPKCILLTDRRNDAALDRAIARLPRGSALVFRHYHLPEAERDQRLAQLRRLCAVRGVQMVLSGPGYGPAARLARRAPLRLATAHSLREIGDAARAQAHAVLLSPVFPTRSHPGGRVLGPVRFLLLARQSPLPVIALGGMDWKRARGLPVHGWAAIDAFR